MPLELDTFIHRLTFEDLQEPVVRQAQRCLLDLAGAAAAGLEPKLSRIIRDHAARNFCADRDPSKMGSLGLC